MSLALFMETAVADTSGPAGFGRGTTGGAGGEIVHVSTPDQLRHELCRSLDATGHCSDSTPRVVVVDTTIDFRGLEGPTSGLGCYPYKNKSESLVLLNNKDTHCDGFPTSQISYDKVGEDPVMVGSNKSVVGAGSKGWIKGTGLRLVSVKNVVIQNLTITDINPSVIFAGDAITLCGVDGVWIDHNRFQMIGRQMIAAGFDSLKHVTISWNDFDGRTPYAAGGDGDHYWNMLFETNAPAVQSVTIADNWVHDFAGRAPIIMGTGVFQIVNNYFQNGSWHALNAYRGINVLLEGNYYEHVRTPVLKNPAPTDVGGVFFLLEGQNNTIAAKACSKYLGRKCGNNVVIGAIDQSGFDQDVEVLQAAQALLPLKTIKPFKTSTVPAVVQAQAGPGHL